MVSELLTLTGMSSPAQEVRRSTEWDPVTLRNRRAPHAEDLIAKGRRCRAKDYRFVEWIVSGCPLGILRLRANMTKTVETFVALLRHDALFQLLSRARAHPLDSTCVLRGYIDDENPDIFRVAASLEENVSGDWQATFKHHLAFVLQSKDSRGSGASAHVAAVTLWRNGALNFIVSAPRSAGGQMAYQAGLSLSNHW